MRRLGDWRVPGGPRLREALDLALERRDAGCGVGRLPRVGCLEPSARALGLGERRGETRPLGALAPQRLVEAGARRRFGRQTVALGLERGDGLAKPVALGREALELRGHAGRVGVPLATGGGRVGELAAQAADLAVEPVVALPRLVEPGGRLPERILEPCALVGGSRERGFELQDLRLRARRFVLERFDDVRASRELGAHRRGVAGGRGKHTRGVVRRHRLPGARAACSRLPLLAQAALLRERRAELLRGLLVRPLALTRRRDPSRRRLLRVGQPCRQRLDLPLLLGLARGGGRRRLRPRLAGRRELGARRVRELARLGRAGLDRGEPARLLAALGRRAAERLGEPRPRTLCLGERGRERRHLLGHAPHPGEVRREPGAVGGRRIEGASEALDLGRPRRDLGCEPLVVGQELVASRGHAGGRDDGSGFRHLGAAPVPARRLDHRGQIAEHGLQRTDVALFKRARRGRNEDQAADRCRPGVQRHAGDRAHRRRRFHQPRHVSIARGALDQIRAAVHEPVERHVPRRGVAAADRSEPPTSFVREADLRCQAEDVLPGVVETERAGVRTALLEQRAQRRLERLLRRPRGRDLRQTLREARGPRADGPRRLGGHSARPHSTLAEHRHGLDLGSRGATGVPPAGPRAVARRGSAARRPSRN